MIDYLQSNHIGVYFIIFFGKIVEVTLATLRNVLINRGERSKGSMVAFFEIFIWVFITGTVLVGFTQAPLKVVIFAFAFAIGNFTGSWLEGQIALGLSTIQIITSDDVSDLLEKLRKNNLAVTSLDAEGKDGARKVLEIHLKRKRIKQTLKLINSNMENGIVTLKDVKLLKGGFITKK